MDADWEIIIIIYFIFFIPLDQKDRTTGSPNHGHANYFYWVERKRKKQTNKKNPTGPNDMGRFLESLFLLRVLGGERRVSRKRMDGGAYSHIYLLICKGGRFGRVPALVLEFTHGLIRPFIRPSLTFRVHSYRSFPFTFPIFTWLNAFPQKWKWKRSAGPVLYLSSLSTTFLRVSFLILLIVLDYFQSGNKAC